MKICLSSDWAWVPELLPVDDEPVIHKCYNSSFEETDLEDRLATLRASHIVLAGAATKGCIRATAYAALDRGYDLASVSDGHTTKTMELDGTTMVAADVVHELNTVMNWVSYPVHTNEASPVREIDFRRFSLAS